MRFSTSFLFSSLFTPGILACVTLAGGLALASVSYAQTADGMTPAEETVCDGQEGALWGLCVAYCEAMDCDHEFPYADEQACERVLTNYLKKSGDTMPPCVGEASDGGEGTGTGETPGEEGGSGEASPGEGGSEGGGSSTPAA